MSEETSGNVKVISRFRPLNEKELKMSTQLCVSFLSDNCTVSMSAESDTPLRFTLDYVFRPESPQVEVYNRAAKPIVQAVMKGFNGTVFAYGQTSSGKTFTMMGPDIEDSDMMGIIPRMVSTVFNQIRESDENIEYAVKVAYSEIYLEKIRDLLNPTRANLRIHEDRNRGVYIADLTETYVTSEEEVLELMRIGSDNREVAYTHMNAGSSRSHSLFMLTISQTNKLDYSAKTGKLYLVDLAGSEKVGKTGAEGKRLEEAKNINKSLTTLGLVINSLTDGKSKHIPYRDSKLTRVLQDSLGGNSKTCLIVTCSPSPYNESETISTLRFGVRAKTIKNKPKVNKEYTVAELKLMLSKAKEEIDKKDKIIRNLTKTLNVNGLESSEDFSEVTDRLDDDENAVDEVICELEEVRNRLSEEVTQNSEMKKNFNELQSEHSAAVEELTMLRELCENQKSTLSANNQKFKDIEDTIESLTVMKEALQRELDETSAAKLQLEQDINVKEVEIKQLKSGKQSSETKDQRELGLEKPQKFQGISSQGKIGVYSKSESSENSLGVFKKVRSPESEPNLARIAELPMEDVEYLAKTGLRPEMVESGEYTEYELMLAKKTEALERNLDHLVVMYHTLASQKSQLRVEKQIYERKVNRLAKRNQELEEELEKAKERIAEEQNTIKTMTEQIEYTPRMSTNMHNFARNIKRTIKGGPNNFLYASQISFPRAPGNPFN